MALWLFDDKRNMKVRPGTTKLALRNLDNTIKLLEHWLKHEHLISLSHYAQSYICNTFSFFTVYSNVGYIYIYSRRKESFYLPGVLISPSPTYFPM